MTSRIRQFLRQGHFSVLSHSIKIQVVGYAVSLALMALAIAFYTPAELGRFAVVLFSANLVGNFAGLKLEWAVINEHSSRIAAYLLRFATTLLLGFGGALFLLALAAPPSLYTTLEIARQDALLAAPISVMVGLGLLQQSWGIRVHSYRDVYFSRNAVLVSRQVLQIGFGLLYPSVTALAATEILARGFGVLILVRRLGKRLELLTPERLRRVARPLLLCRYRHYTWIALPSSVVDFAMSESLPVLLLLVHGPEIAGAYWLVQRIFGIPVALIGTVVGDIFQGQMARERDPAVIQRHMRHTALLLAVSSLCLMPAGAVMFRILSELFYGGKWLLSGQLSLILLPAICVQFVASPLSRSFIVLQKMQYKYVFDGTMLLFLGLWLTTTNLFDLSVLYSFVFLSAAQVVAYFVYIALSFQIVRNGSSFADFSNKVRQGVARAAGGN